VKVGHAVAATLHPAQRGWPGWRPHPSVDRIRPAVHRLSV